MDLKDDDLKRFCLQMKNSKLHHKKSNSSNKNLVTAAMLYDMQTFIKENPSFNNLSDKNKQSLKEVFTAYAPTVNQQFRDDYRIYFNSPRSQQNVTVICINTGPSHSGSGDGCGGATPYIVALIVGLCALFATIKAILDILSYIDAIYHNEGRLRASLNLLTMAVIFSTAAALIVSFLLATLAAGNPIGLASFIVSSLIVVGAYCSYWLLARIMDAATSGTNMVNCDNPYESFTMTPKEAKHLDNNGTDSLKVRVAIILLQSEMSTRAPAWYDSSKLQQIRDLRFGRKFNKSGLNSQLGFDFFDSTGQTNNESAKGNINGNYPQADAFVLDPFLAHAYYMEAEASAPPAEAEAEAAVTKL